MESGPLSSLPSQGLPSLYPHTITSQATYSIQCLMGLPVGGPAQPLWAHKESTPPAAPRPLVPTLHQP